METQDENGKTVYQSVPLQSVLHHSGKEGLEFIETEDIVTEQQYEDIVEAHEDVVETHVDAVNAQHESIVTVGEEGSVVEVDQGGFAVEGHIMEVEGNVMYEVSGEEIIGVQEALERQGIQVVQHVETR